MIIKKTCNFEYEEKDGRFCIQLVGEIDHHSAVAVRSAIDAKLYEFRPRHTVLDLSGIDFMDSSGIGLVMGRFKLLKSIGGKIKVTNLSPGAYKVMCLAGIERLGEVKQKEVI